MNHDPRKDMGSERIEAYGSLCQFHERLLIASTLLEDCIDEFAKILAAHAPDPVPTIFR